MNKRVIRTLIILIVLIAVAVYIRRSTNVPENQEVTTVENTTSNAETQTDVQYVLPDDEVSLKINGVNDEPVQENEFEQEVEVGVQPVRYTRDLGV